MRISDWSSDVCSSDLLHPLSGVDHLLAMLMVGLWAGIAFPRFWWVCPAAFISFMLGGFAHGAAGGAFPIAEMLILASLVGRSEESRVGKECVSTGRIRWSADT